MAKDTSSSRMVARSRVAQRAVEPRSLSLAQGDLLRLLRALENPRDKAIIHLLVGLGCSITELTRLRVGAIKPEGVRIGGMSGSDGRMVLIDESLVAILEALIEERDDSAPLLVSREGTALTRRRIEQILARASRAVGRRIVGKTIARTAGLASLGQRALNAEQRDALLSAIASKPVELPARLILETGCTVAELVALRMGDFDLEERTVIIPAGWSRRKEPAKISISARTCALIRSRERKRHMVPKDILLSKRTNPNQGLSALRIQQMLKDCDAAVGFHVTPSALRASCMHELIKKGAAQSEICKQLGLRRMPSFKKG